MGTFAIRLFCVRKKNLILFLAVRLIFRLGSGVTGDHPQKIACRFEMLGDIADYCAAAAPRLDRGGIFACVFPVTPEAQQGPG